VVRDYSDSVNLIENADEFCNSIKSILDRKDHLPLQMKYYKILAQTSWNATTDKMKSIIKKFAK
jgi:hypothetical protein